MSLWDDFTKTLESVVKEIIKTPVGLIDNIPKLATRAVMPTIQKVAPPINKYVVGPVAGQVSKTASGIMQGFNAAGYSVGGTQAGVIANAGINMATSRIASQSGIDLSGNAAVAMSDLLKDQTAPRIQQYDPMLATSVAAEKYVFSPVIKRPIATAALVADPTSALYDDGVYGKGFQWDDVRAAYNRTEKVSLGIALTKSLYNPLLHITGLDETAKKQGLDLDNVNLWNDEDIKKNFTDNTLGRYMSGITDAVVGNIAIQAGITGGLGALKLGARAAGFTNNLKLKDVESLSKAEKLITDHFTPGGTKSQFGSDVERLAASKDPNEIMDILSVHTNNPRLPNLIRNTEDPLVVRDFILADKGYGPAIERLSTLKMSDDLWIMSDAGKELYAEFIKTGKMPQFTFEQRKRVSAAFDDAIAKNEKHQEVFDAFMRDERIIGPTTQQMSAVGMNPGELDMVPRMFGKDYKPMEPIIGSSIYSKVRTRSSELRTAAVNADFSKVGGMTQVIVGRKGAPTALIKFVSGKMPRGVVTNSGLRPFDAIEEVNAHFDDLTLFRNGSTPIKIIKDGEFTTIPASEYRRNFIAEYLDAPTDGERGMILDKLNAALIYDVARTHGVPQRYVEAFVEQATTNLRKFHNDLSVESFAMDPSGVRIQVDPNTQRQLRNGTPLLPVGSIEADILRSKGKAAKVRGGVADAANFTYEFGNKAFSFTQLVRPSYIGKNSIIEPLVVSVLSHGSKAVTDEFASMFKNAVTNNKNRVLRAIQASSNLTSPAKKALADDFELLTKEYNDSVELVENHIAEYSDYFIRTDGRSPQTKFENSDRVRRDLNQAERQLRDIEERINDAAPEFTKAITKQPTLYGLTRRVVYLENLAKNSPKFNTKVELFPGLTSYKDGGSGGLPGTGETVGLVKTSALKGMNGNEPGNTEALASYRKSLREGKGFAIRDYEGKPYQDPVMVVYDNETGLAYVGEGNHRLQAAIDENIPYVPVRVVRGRTSEMKVDIKQGKFPKQIKGNKEPKFVETRPGSEGKPVGEGYVPPEMHPSYVFDEKYIVPKDEYTQVSTVVSAIGSDIANAKAAIAKAAGDINTLAPDLRAIEKLIATQYAKLDAKIQEFGRIHGERADLYFVSENRSVKYGSQRPFTAVMPNGEKVEGIPQFGDKNSLGTAYQSEVANTHTRQIELTGNKIFGSKINMFNRRGPAEITDITSPYYFDELAFVVNNYMKGDILVDQILSGSTRAELLAWGKTRQGSSYAREFGKSKEDIVSIIDNQVAYVNRYLPSEEAQILVSRGEVSGNELAGILSKRPQDLTPIHPLDVAYETKTPGTANFSETLDRLTAKAWTTLATPENKIRYAWASTEYKQRVTDKLAALQAQGYEINSTSVINGIRQSSAAEVVQELEKTFYSIRRQNRALFTARTVMAFPTASASGIYRYSRMALKNPARFGGFLNSYYGLYNSFGVDKYGNPVDNPLKAEYFIVPGTKEMGLNAGKGIMLPARATNFAVNFAGPSYIVPISIGQIYKNTPLKDGTVKKIVDNSIGKIPGYSYDELFPFGVETDLKKAVPGAFTPGWLPSLRKYLQPNGDGSLDWTNSLISEYEYQGMLYDLDMGPRPTHDSVYKAAKNNFKTKFIWQFGSLVGTPAYVETRPMGVFQDFFNAKANSYSAMKKLDGTPLYSRTEAAALAEKDLNAMLRLPKGKKFPTDRINQKAYTKVTYVPRSQEAIDRIWTEHAGLAEKLASLDAGGSLVGLLTADLPVGTNPQAGKFLDDPNRTLPGGDYLNNRVKTIAQMDARLEKSRYWKAYTDVKNSYDEAAKNAGYASYRSVPELVDELRKYASQLGESSPVWNSAYKKSLNGDNAVTQAIGLRTVLNDKKFMEQYGNTQFWQHAKAFMSYRDDYAKLRADVPAGSKTLVQEYWVNYLEKTRKDWDPALMNMIDRYFINDSLASTNIKPKENK